MIAIFVELKEPDTDRDSLQLCCMSENTTREAYFGGGERKAERGQEVKKPRNCESESESESERLTVNWFGFGPSRMGDGSAMQLNIRASPVGGTTLT